MTVFYLITKVLTGSRLLLQNIMVIDPLVAWRLISVIRAIAGLLNWLLLALSPNSNMLLRQIRNPVCQHFLIFFFPKTEINK